MKKIIYFLLLFMGVQAVDAQNSYDVMRFASDELSGTARFVGMGGSMGALGTDISVISTNPAGIGLYRSFDAVATVGLHTVENKASFLGCETKDNKVSMAFDNIGLVFSTYHGGDNLKYVNFAFNYRHRNHFSNNMEIAGSLIDGDNNYFSQQYALKTFYGKSGDYIDYNDYYSLDYPWLGLLTSTSGLIDKNGNLAYVPEGSDGRYPTYMNYRSKEKGGVDDIDVNISCNVNDMLYLGVTFTASNVDYTRAAEYTEFCDNYDYYTIQNSYNVSGNGFGVKVGAIVRPFEYSPLKIGLALHSPIWYGLTDRTSATMYGTTENNIWDTRDYDAYGEDLFVDYEYTTPWRMNLSASYTFDTFAAINAEYELVDYSTAGLEYTDGFDMDDLNTEIEANMKTQHIFRVGALFNLDDNLSLRCGYNYISAPNYEDAAKTIFKMYDTSTEYMNRYETNVLTLGLGYACESFYMDFAYKLAMQKADFYNYYDSEYVNPAATVDITRQSLLMSMGFRF